MICTVVGARPNFIKMAPIIHEMERRGLPPFFVHTGQHYDVEMSRIFFDDLGLPEPDVYLGVGSGSHATQTAKVMTAFEEVCSKQRFDLVVVAGDVNSTLACALVSAKMLIPVAHVEAGLRSRDRSMPEEINRILTDHLADLLFATESDAVENLRREGVADRRIHFVGNSMIDSLRAHLPKALGREPWLAYGCVPGQYFLATFHRPVNVDDRLVAAQLASALAEISRDFPVIFPIHPRTYASTGDVWASLPSTVNVVKPLGYLEFLGLMARARAVVTDSGGIQEETTALRVPCVTVRSSTERPVTVTTGTNRLVGIMCDEIVAATRDVDRARGEIPELWDGRAAGRIVDVISAWLHEEKPHPLRGNRSADSHVP